MKRNLSKVALLVLTCITAYSTVDARRRHHRAHRGASTASFFAGTATGIALSGAFNRRPRYYRAPRVVIPRPVFVQPQVIVNPLLTQPLMTYTYPMYSYSPAYLYSNPVYACPGYYLSY